LLILDKSSELATVDDDAFETLMRDVHTGEQAIADMLTEWAQDLGIVSPDFQPATEDDQSRLDEKSKISCPECGHEFTP
jgi:ferritin-like metal-binding protein YciE